MQGRWLAVAILTIGSCLGAGVLTHAQLFRPFTDRSSSLLEGNWQSCREQDGQYAERVYDGKWPGIEPFELHLGPFHEFALFRGIQPDHRDHNSAENLLKPFTVELIANQAARTWDIAGLHFEVQLAGGSRDECESWFITLKRSQTSSH